MLSGDDETDVFELHVAFGGDSVTASVHGEVDLLTAPALSGLLNSFVDSGYRDIVVDLAKCRFIDASGLNALVGAAVRMSETHDTIAIRSASALLRRILELTQLSDFIPLVGEVPADAVVRRSPSTVASSRAFVRSGNAVVDAALRLVTALADATIDNADGVSVTLERHGQLMTAAASNDKVLTMDKHQYDTGEGPCLAAKAEGTWHYIESLDDETRWPAFVPLALGQGIHSILSSPLMADHGPQGALNIYSSHKRAFGARERELAAMFAEQASEILTTAGTDMSHKMSNRRFTGALTERRTIHQAQGMVMARNVLNDDDAIARLFRGARAAGVTLLTYATDIVASAVADAGRE